MPSAPLTAVPASLVVGDSLRMRFAFEGYSPDEWALQFALIGPTQTTLSVSTDGDGWIVTLPAESDDVAPGLYGWAIRLASLDDTERLTVRSGQMVVTSDPQAEDATVPSDQRSFERKALEQIEAAILARSTLATSFSVFGRTYTFSTHAELLAYRNQLRAMVNAEDEAAARAAGQPSSSVAWVRFGRP